MGTTISGIAEGDLANVYTDETPQADETQAQINNQRILELQNRRDTMRTSQDQFTSTPQANGVNDGTFVSQVSGPTNPNAIKGQGNCLPTSLVMVGREFGKLAKDPNQSQSQINKVRQDANASPNNKEGVSYEEGATAAKKMGLQGKVVTENTDELKNSTDNKNKKVIVGVNPAILDPNRGYGPNEHHAIVVDSVDKAKDTAVIEDPNNQEGHTVVKLSDLEKARSTEKNKVLEVST